MKKLLSLLLLMLFLSVGFTSCFLFKKCSHFWDTGTLINATQCGENSIARFTCLKCGKTKEDHTPKHNYVSVNTVVPGCTSKGYTKYECLRCDSEYMSDYVNELGHNYVAVKIVEPGCATMGYTEYECSRCGVTCVSDFLNARGHDYNNDIVVKEATCTSNGVYEKGCTHCDTTYRYFKNASGHSYFLISDDDVSSTYECGNCFVTLTVNDGDVVEEFVGGEELFNVEDSFTFDIVSSENEEYIKKRLKIINNYHNNTEYENESSVAQEYTLTYNGNDIWTVSVISNYKYDTTYIAKLQDDLSFADYKGTELTFTVISNPNHQDVYEYQDGIVFLKSLELANPGYYPYNILSSEESEFLYLTINKTDGLKVDTILCIGEITSVDQITADAECYFGKITEFYPLSDGTWMVVLSEPDITEIFDELDISYNEDINFDNENIDIEYINTEIEAALYNSDDFVKFISVVNLSAKEYYDSNGYYADELSDIKSFMSKINIVPNVTFSGDQLLATINGTLSLPIKDGNKKEIGEFKVSFTVELSSTFKIDVMYRIERYRLFLRKFAELDINVTQTDNFNFNFEVSIELNVSLEENSYVQNIESGKIHRTSCIHLKHITDNSKLNGLSAMTAEKYINENPDLECKHCRPIKGFKSDLVVINTRTKVVHKYDYTCIGLASMSDENKQISQEKASYWLNLNDGYTCCNGCYSDNHEEKEYEAIYSETLYCSDWQKIATDVSQWAKDSGIKKHNEDGITIIKKNISIYGPILLTFDIRFVFELDIEGTFEYEYSYTQINIYGARKQGNGMAPYYQKIASNVIKNHCSVIGKIDIKTGLLIDANVNIAGLSKWVRAGVTAELGAYAHVAGVLSISFNQANAENYMAAYLEAGIYLDLDAYYHLLWWNDEYSLYSNKWPLLTMGYERAYFEYVTYHDKLFVKDSFDITSSDLLEVKYFDLNTMTVKTDKLSLLESEKYNIDIRFVDGSYCRIVNGVILLIDDAPARFTDTLVITVNCDAKWQDFKKDSYVYYLGYYEIEIEFSAEDLYTKNGDYIYFGEYPQTIKTDDVIITSTIDDRGYYLGSDGYYYAMIVANPYSSSYTFSSGDVITEGSAYYFKVEPIRWRILAEDGDHALILCDSIISNMAYSNNYNNNYEQSDIRAWLNDTFYKTAFTEFQQQIIIKNNVDNSIESTGYSYNSFVCDNTTDKLFILSYREITNNGYGFSANGSAKELPRRMYTSDYSRAMGVYTEMNTSSDYYGNGYWWLRSPNNLSECLVRFVYIDGCIREYDVGSNYSGIVPALVITL